MTGDVLGVLSYSEEERRLPLVEPVHPDEVQTGKPGDTTYLERPPVLVEYR